ncbi:HNH endonuclease [Rhizobium laguerreae]|uniref:HNH endonuclease n=1 Tax=Rhizobium laguerreae TaxID=1076926 RepID=UPI001C924D9C|nr:HNH endonuclease [Rhizobium laguerreae]MBY3255603.1 HNH endonuclease [Rhizobium laguerreae]MBY3282642.1 HNH endonuclease [Rhizobium laguerreae]MBY3288996.1 HNH endonuclease [Rhizobium laguerreae]
MAVGILEYFRRLEVWGKLEHHATLDPREWRNDAHGRLIRFSDYGRRDSDYGWELDHYPVPKALGGSDDLSNIRALHWRGNAVHGGLLGLGLASLSKNEKPSGLGGLFGLYSKR